MSSNSMPLTRKISKWPFSRWEVDTPTMTTVTTTITETRTNMAKMTMMTNTAFVMTCQTIPTTTSIMRKTVKQADSCGWKKMNMMTMTATSATTQPLTPTQTTQPKKSVKQLATCGWKATTMMITMMKK